MNNIFQFADGSYNCAVILGATATGKTARAVAMAKEKNGEIISADSRQVYRGLDIGSGKDLHEYGAVPYHLIDICDLDEEYTVFHFQKDVYRLFPSLIDKGVFPVIAGGTGLYLDAILREYNLIPVPENTELRADLSKKSLPELQTILLGLKQEIHNTTDLEKPARLIRAIEIAMYLQQNPAKKAELAASRPCIMPKVYGIFFERAVLRERIYRRLIERIDAGMIEEAEALHRSGVSWQRLDSLGLEYRFIAQYLQGAFPNKEIFIQKLYQAICQFAKRQETWFRRMMRNSVDIEIIS